MLTSERPSQAADYFKGQLGANPRSAADAYGMAMAQLRLGNSLQGLILVYLTFSLPLATWLLQGYFRGVPRELEERHAARRDGGDFAYEALNLVDGYRSVDYPAEAHECDLRREDDAEH